MKLKFFFPAILGTIVENYDQALYGFSAGVIAYHFFPDSDPTISLLKAYTVFLVGHCSKSLGALFFGYLGDKYGRSLSLKISMFGIAIPTLLIGLMPGYEVLGWWPALLLPICRMLQGIFVSGESDGVRIFIFESMKKTRPCFANSISGMAIMIGVYLASVAASTLTGPNLPDYAWRIPFLIGAFSGLLVILLRQYLTETPDYLKYQQFIKTRKTKSTDSANLGNNHSFIQVLSNNKLGVFITAILYGVVGGGSHFYFIFMGPYLSKSLAVLGAKEVTRNIEMMILIYTLCAPVAGYIADRFDAMKILKISALSFVGVLFISSSLLTQGLFPTWLWILTAINLTFLHTPIFVILLKLFDVGERFRCISFGHAMGSMFFSGTIPAVSLYLWKKTQYPAAPLAYLVFITLLGYMALKLCDYKKDETSRMRNMPVYTNVYYSNKRGA